MCRQEFKTCAHALRTDRDFYNHVMTFAPRVSMGRPFLEQFSDVQVSVSTCASPGRPLTHVDSGRPMKTSSRLGKKV